jgi:hypothetical protein
VVEEGEELGVSEYVVEESGRRGWEVEYLVKLSGL